MPEEYHILDTETASLQGGVCEIAWLTVDNDLNILSEFCTYVNPERLIEEGAKAVHGITEELVAGKPTLAQVGQFLPASIHLIAHNAAFDARMIKEAINVESQLCSLQLARQFVKGTTNHKLEVLQAELALPEQQSHSALGDVHTVRDLLLHILGLTGEKLPELWKRAQKPKLLHKMPYGKYKGLPFNLVPRPYRIWLLEQGGLDKDLEYTLQQLKGL